MPSSKSSRSESTAFYPSFKGPWSVYTMKNIWHRVAHKPLILQPNTKDGLVEHRAVLSLVTPRKATPSPINQIPYKGVQSNPDKLLGMMTALRKMNTEVGTTENQSTALRCGHAQVAIGKHEIITQYLTHHHLPSHLEDELERSSRFDISSNMSSPQETMAPRAWILVLRRRGYLVTSWSGSRTQKFHKNSHDVESRPPPLHRLARRPVHSGRVPDRLCAVRFPHLILPQKEQR